MFRKIVYATYEILGLAKLNGRKIRTLKSSILFLVHLKDVF